MHMVNGTPASGREIKALTSLRGFAALAVVTQHFSATAQSYSSGWIPSLVPHGYMAVDFFFILSGFIMSYTYLPHFRADGIRAFVPFLLKRVARIMPLGLFVLLVILLLGGIAALSGHSDLFINQNAVQAGLATAIIVNILHLQGFSYKYNLNDPSWSVSLEMSAYLLFPLLIYVVFRGPRLLMLAYLLAGTTVLASAAIAQPRLALNDRGVLIDVTRCFTEFGYGMLVYRLYETAGPLNALGKDLWTWAITMLAVLMLMLRVDLLAMFCFPPLVLAWARNNGVASRMMSSRLPYFLGTISFSIYLVHHMFRRPAMAVVQHFFTHPIPPLAAIAFAVAGSLVVIPFAYLSYRYVELPGRKALNRLFRQPHRVFVPVNVVG
jgi:peptidoglycan/LPS O-acetylase OafA/YrhL